MAPSKRTQAKKPKSSPSPSSTTLQEPPQPFKRAPEVMAPLLSTLSPKHVYITHIDSKPVEFKRKIFLVPIVINLAITALFAYRMYHIGPWYFKLIASAFGHSNETTVPVAESSWSVIARIIARRAFTFSLDCLLFIFVWPWPVEFCFDGSHGSPLMWRWGVGFRGKEIYIRRSKPNWDTDIKKAVKGDNAQARNLLMNHVGVATAPMLINEKTGYLTMNNEWDLDWAAMVKATKLVDDKSIALEAFKLMVVLHHEDYGWVSLDLKMEENAQDVARRTQVFAFRDALAAVGKEDLFYRWIEIVQFESTQPGGFGADKQVEVAKQIRELFAEQGIDFDEFWKESVGSDGLANM
ncbi:hypothetical protein M406DRAFT_51085 [Cryphonectria parasitica EP155]|uniref:Uncharacterized protein n=1 Tax=Cryphonectria parasitica (strain ATCC 38755 / EP155) TaxID=660469 RepID=A0A9P4XZI2_CRYP1|nr:uncharacterized protein M406DRAFT_51085 [Cryphonectria parasitica EP155]KAF3763786.1 hypothetical protein M406DRAFT_51085 [Cryphonectria parasitica EP155]